jgi:predicted PurR-regulated permease PerM
MSVVSIISGVADNIVRPYLTGQGEVQIHGFITFLAIIGGVLVMGLPGLFVGPLLALLTFGALPIILDDYFPTKNHE